jgi:hypothetical protein
MDNQHFPFAAFPYPQTAMEDPVFQPHHHVFDHFNPAIGSYIDPNLQSPSPSEPYLSQWEPPQVTRWITDDQKTAYFNAEPFSKTMTVIARRPLGIHPIQPPSHTRFASPTSSSDHAFTAPSPLADTESYCDNNNLPSTPSDSAVLSPSYHPGHFECYNSQESAIQFINMGPAAPAAYVKPEDVDPSAGLGYCDAEASQPDFTLEHRSYSFESATSHHDVEHTQNQITVAIHNRRGPSPEGMRPVKAEREAPFQYPPPPEPEDDDDASDVLEERPVFKRKKDDDHDYTPGKKIKASDSSPRRRTRPKPVPTKQPAADRSPKRKAPAPSTAAANPPTKPATSSSSKGKAFSCPHCKHTNFKDETTLETHIKKQHTRPFKCVFHFAGCTSTFASKNEWKRHNSTQHLVLNFWLCTEGQCGRQAPASGGGPSASAAASRLSKTTRNQGSSTLYSNTFDTPPSQHHQLAAAVSAPPPPLVGVRFNRKDLYTQHVRRMHMPPHIKKDIKLLAQQQNAGTTKPTPPRKNGPPPPRSPLELTKAAWEEQLKQRQEAAVRDRIVLPTYMRCPARGCVAEFRGAEAWDQRMEHVAKHLESGDRGEVVFGGPEDDTLLSWAGREDVGVVVRCGEGWVLNRVLGRGSGVRKERRGEEEEDYEDEDEGEVGGEIVVDDGERDAEGEEE